MKTILTALSLLLATASAAASATASERPLACTDFDAYVNGEWARATELPPDRARIGSFDILRRDNDRLLTRALAELAADPALQAWRASTAPGSTRRPSSVAAWRRWRRCSRASTPPPARRCPR
jgi:hypothetical protein